MQLLSRQNTAMPKEECGIFGIFFPYPDFTQKIVSSTLAGLIANQHRGEESAGICVANGKTISEPFKKMGVVRTLYQEYLTKKHLKDNLRGHLAIAHTRYSTTGSSNIINAAPFLFKDKKLGQIAVGHNGNITNAQKLKRELIEKGYRFESTTDSEIIGNLIIASPGVSWEERMGNAFKQLEGSFSLVLCTKNALYGARDPAGVRPLSIAEFRLDQVTGYALSSESAAFHNLSIDYKRDVQPGEIIKFNEKGIHCQKFTRLFQQAFCGLEIAYLMRPDSRLEGVQLDTIRRHLGAKLAQLYPPPKTIDFVTYIPESSKSVAEGFTQALSRLWKKPVVSLTSMLKNRYGTINGAIRGFINPDSAIRTEVAQSNYHPLDLLLKKEVALVDDSIIRGTTTKGVIQTLRQKVGDLKQGGVGKIHLRIIFPPVVGYCPLGTDISQEDRLIAKELKNAQNIARFLELDSLAYLSPEEFREGVNEVLKQDFGLCLGCATGDYPVPGFQADKKIFEKKVYASP